MSNDPDLLDVWVECGECSGEGVVLGEHGLDVDCPACKGDGGWERTR